MPSIDVADETFVVSSPAAVAAYVSDPARWRAWFKGLTLTVVEDRGLHGVRWKAAGELVGTAEIWIEAVKDGAVIHTFLRGECGSRSGARAQREAASLWALRVKAMAFGVKDALEEGRQRPAGDSS